MLLLLFHNQQPAPPAAGYVNLSVALAGLWTALNATGEADAVYWTSDQMFQWFDQAAKLLGRTQNIFVDYDQSLHSVLNQADYTLPTTQVSTIQADLNKRTLRARNVQEIEALDSMWTSTKGTPASFLQDVQGVVTVTLYPAPDAASAGLPLGLVIAEVPADITPTNGFLIAPQCLQEYFTFYALAEARVAETHAQMPEAAQFFGGIVDLMRSAITGYWGRDDG